ncbi:MAG: 2TM domain-containing protein [Hyphomicrobium sp.]
MLEKLDKIAEARAAKQFSAIRGFYIHCFVFVLVSLGLVLINVLTAGKMWAHWAIAGWGLGVIGHAYGAFVATPKRLAAWEAKALEQAKSGKA